MGDMAVGLAINDPSDPNECCVFNFSEKNYIVITTKYLNSQVSNIKAIFCYLNSFFNDVNLFPM